LAMKSSKPSMKDMSTGGEAGFMALLMAKTIRNVASRPSPLNHLLNRGIQSLGFCSRFSPFPNSASNMHLFTESSSSHSWPRFGALETRASNSDAPDDDPLEA